MRPSYIPSTTYVNNRSYNVYYERRYGGYGYLDNGQWRYYDAMADAVILSSLMNNHSYYYPRTNVVHSNGDIVVTDGGDGWGIVLGIFIGIGWLLIIGFCLKRLITP